MNILVFFVAGVSVGWAVDKLYHSFVGNREYSGGEEITTKDEGNESSETTEKRDDLSQLKGVGPKLAEALDEIGIYNYKQLSTSSLDELLVRLRETGGRFTMPAISSIVERAKLAVAK